MVLHPQHVLVIWAGYVQVNFGPNGRHRPWVSPFVDLRMAIGERKATGPAMIAGRIINDFRRGEFRVAIHFDYEIGVIDAVLTFVQDDIGHRRSGPIESGELAENYKVPA